MSERTIPDNRKESLPHEHADVSANRSPAELVLDLIRSTRNSWTLSKAGKVPIDYAADVKELWNLYDERIGAPPDIGDVKDQQQARTALRLMEAALTAILTTPSVQAPVHPSEGTELRSNDEPPGTRNDNALTFTAGGFMYRGVEEPLPGKPLEVLKALHNAARKERTRIQLHGMCWNVAVESSTVGNAVSDARKALRHAMERAGTIAPQDAHKDYPIVTVNRGGGDGANDRAAWRLLDLP